MFQWLSSVEHFLKSASQVRKMSMYHLYSAHQALGRSEVRSAEPGGYPDQNHITRRSLSTPRTASTQPGFEMSINLVCTRRLEDDI